MGRSKSHIRVTFCPDAASREPSGLKARLVGSRSEPRSFATHLRVFKSHSRISNSSEAVAMIGLLGCRAKPVILEF